jgi:hypothetical protein
MACAYYDFARIMVTLNLPFNPILGFVKGRKSFVANTSKQGGCGTTVMLLFAKN